MSTFPKQALITVLLGLTSCREAADPPPPPNAVPADVANFVARRDGCEALRRYTPNDGEDLHDLARDRSEMCDDLGEALVELRRSYRGDPRIIGLLHDAPRTHDRS